MNSDKQLEQDTKKLTLFVIYMSIFVTIVLGLIPLI